MAVQPALFLTWSDTQGVGHPGTGFLVTGLNYTMFYPVHHKVAYQMSIMISYDCQFSNKFSISPWENILGASHIEKGF